MSNCIYSPMKGLYLGQSIQEWTKLNLWKTAFKKYSVICPALADHIGQISYRLSSTNLTWSILEYFAPFLHIYWTVLNWTVRCLVNWIIKNHYSYAFSSFPSTNFKTLGNALWNKLYQQNFTWNIEQK